MLDEALRSLADNIRDGLIVVDGGRLCWANVPFGAMAGRIGACLNELPVDEVLRGLPAPSKARGPEVVEAEVLHTDGRPRAVRCVRAWYSPGLDACAWLIEDLDAPRALEDELLQRARELAACNREIAALRCSFETERELWEESRAELGHEIRTPLTVLGGYTRLLLSEEPGVLNAEQRRFLEESQRSCRRLGKFLDKMLDPCHAGRIEAPLELGCGALGPVVEDVAAMFRPLLLERQLELTLAIDGIPVLSFDALRVEQVLTNLLGNALKHAPSGSSIRIEARVPEPGVSGQSFVEVSVEDEGPGICAKDRERVFDPYVQLGNQNGGPIEGRGLGLSICRRLVEAHGGRIQLDATGGRGARFVFTLPMTVG
ncbi:MAG: HAMP domain-containing sensor histidine kinase, partial [Myxococcota bacterium]